MISTHFPLNFPIKTDMFFPSMLFVNHTRYECCAGGTTCNHQQSLFPAAGSPGSALSPPAVPGQGADRGLRGEVPQTLSRSYSLH